jgi:hypothetical protein
MALAAYRAALGGVATMTSISSDHGCCAGCGQLTTVYHHADGPGYWLCMSCELLHTFNSSFEGAIARQRAAHQHAQSVNETWEQLYTPENSRFALRMLLIDAVLLLLGFVLGSFIGLAVAFFILLPVNHALVGPLLARSMGVTPMAAKVVGYVWSGVVGVMVKLTLFVLLIAASG